MIIANRLKEFIKKKGVGLDQLSGQISRSGLDVKKAKSAISNWQKGLLKPQPSNADIEALAKALGVEVGDLRGWKSSYKYAPVSPTKARLVTELVAGRDVQDALDLLKFTNKRAAVMVEKALKSAVANADEQEADVESLFVYEARVDGGGVRLGTKRWHPKDRGRAHAIRKQCCHINIVVAEEMKV